MPRAHPASAQPENIGGRGLAIVRLRGRVVGSRICIDIAHGLALSDDAGNRINSANRKANAIIAYLKFGPSAAVSREKLVGLLWSEQDEETARTALRQCLRRLRATLAEHGLDHLLAMGRAEIRLDREGVISDLDHACAAIERGEIDKRLGQQFSPDDILYGYDLLDPSFASWLPIMRNALRDRLVRTLEDALRGSSPDMLVQIAAATALFDFDPTRESAARFLIEHELARSNKSAALAIYQRLWSALDETWGEEPSEALQKIIVEAKSETPSTMRAPPLPATTAPPAPTTERAPTIYVEHFRQHGHWGQPAYLIEGFRHELIASLVRFREWIVVEEPGATAPQASYLLSGGFRETEHGALLTLTLLDGARRQYLMSEQFTIGFDSWVTAVQKVLRKVSLAVNVNLIQRNRLTIPTGGQIGSDVFELWLQANSLLVSWRRDRFDRAEAIFREIIQRAPEFAAAYSSTASIISTRHLCAPGLRRHPDWEAEALDFAARSVALDPLDGRNQLALAWAHAMRSSYAQAELHFEHSNELNPNSAKTLVPCAQGLSYCGQRSRALGIVAQALELHPDILPAHWGYIMCIHFLSGQYAEAIAAAERAGDSVLDFSAWKAAALALQGRGEEAHLAAGQFLQAIRDKWAGDVAPTAEAIVDWFLHSFPIRLDEDRRHLREGLRAAGLPASG